MQIMQFIQDKIQTFYISHAFLALVVAKLPAAKNRPVFWTILYCISNTSKPLYLCLLCSLLLTWLWNSQKYRAHKNLGVYSIICYHSATQLLQKWQSQKEKRTLILARLNVQLAM